MLDPRPSLDALAPWVERLVTATSAGVRDRLLLDAVRALVGAQGVGLWRCVVTPAGPGWRPWLERGDLGPLPAEALVRAVLQGELGIALPGGVQVVSGPTTALVLTRTGEEGAELAEALLTAHALLEDPSSGSGSVEGPAWLADPDLPGTGSPPA